MQKTCFKNVEDVIVPAQYHSFCLADYYCDGIRILVFCAKKTIESLKTVRHILVDGTFTACPEPFMQIFSLHGDIGTNRGLINEYKYSSLNLRSHVIKNERWLCLG